jgi:hypothetical protein
VRDDDQRRAVPHHPRQWPRALADLRSDRELGMGELREEGAEASEGAVRAASAVEAETPPAPKMIEAKPIEP